jgi:hypothetical protein
MSLLFPASNVITIPSNVIKDPSSVSDESKSMIETLHPCLHPYSMYGLKN